jgi:cell division protease FtsH
MLPLAVDTPFIEQVQAWAITWLPILLMCALVYLIWRTLKSMPRTKPQQIKPEGSGAINWDDVAGCDEAKHELREVVEFLRSPDRFKKLGASVPK